MKTCAPSFRGKKALITILALSLYSRAFPVDLLVYNNIDGGPGSLRQAVIDNNTSAGGNTIVFSNIVSGTITLTNGELLITRPVIIAGPGAGILAVNGNGTNRVFHIQITNNNTVAFIAGLTITNGAATNIVPNSGGGIWNDHSTLRVDNCIVSGNRAGLAGAGIWNDGSSSNGAGLFVEGCTFSGNFVGTFGGGIYNGGSQGSAGVSVRACAFNSNTAFGGGGGIYNDAYQGFATVSVDASTFSSNQVTASFSGSGGGAIYNHGLFGSATLFVSASTFNGDSAPGSGGSIYNNAPTGSATLEMGNTILRAGSTVTIANFLGTVTSRGYNLSSDNGGGVLTNATDQLNTDPLLGPLANNGGRTFTHAPLPGSPAIDHGKWNTIPSLSLSLDQRGAPRPYDFASITNAPGGDGSDVGAFELASPQLNVQQAGSSAALSWPSYYGDFSLQSSTNIESSNSWILAGGSPTVVGNQYQQTNGPIAPNRFFRLLRN